MSNGFEPPDHDGIELVDINKTNFYFMIGDMYRQVKETKTQVVALNKAVLGNGENGLLQKHEILFTRFSALNGEHTECKKDRDTMADALLMLQQDVKRRREQEARYRWNKKQWAAVLGLLFTGMGILIQLFEYRETIAKVIAFGAKH